VVANIEAAKINSGTAIIFMSEAAQDIGLCQMRPFNCDENCFIVFSFNYILISLNHGRLVFGRENFNHLRTFSTIY